MLFNFGISGSNVCKPGYFVANAAYLAYCILLSADLSYACLHSALSNSETIALSSSLISSRMPHASSCLISVSVLTFDLPVLDREA